MAFVIVARTLPLAGRGSAELADAHQGYVTVGSPGPIGGTGPEPNGFVPVRCRRPADATRAALVEVLALGCHSPEFRRSGKPRTLPKIPRKFDGSKSRPLTIHPRRACG